MLGSTGVVISRLMPFRGALCCVMLLALGCTAGSSSAPRTGSVVGAPEARPNKTLGIVIQIEPKSLAFRFSLAGGRWGQRMLFNAGLSYVDERESPTPQLAESIPQMNMPSWLIQPDGRMETTYVLKPNLTWHDGTPFTAQDVVFTRRVVIDPMPGLFVLQPEDREIEEILAPDPRTVVIRWKGPYREAGSLNYAPLPRHLLEEAFDQGDPVSFSNHPYWSTDYMQLGPYRVERWEPGSFIEATAFAGYALGRPKIDRVKLMWAPDPNVAVTYLLSGQAHLAVDNGVTLDSTPTLRREWASKNGGSVLLSATEVRYLQTQLRREYASPTALLDPRVRGALLHTIDRKALADAILAEAVAEGEGRLADTYVPPTLPYYAGLERAISKYPFDLRRAEQLLAEVGIAKGGDGWYASAADGRFEPDLRGRAGLENQEVTIVTDNWKRAGINASQTTISAAQTSDQEARSTFPGMAATFSIVDPGSVYGKFVTSAAASPANRWTGINRGGWSNPEFDRLVVAFAATMERDGASSIVTQTMKILSEELPGLPLYYSYDVTAHSSDLRGPHAPISDTTAYPNIHLWEWQ